MLTTRAAPEFWLGMMVLAVFAFGLEWFPSGGANVAGARYASEWDRILSLDFLRHLALPVLTLAIYLQGLPVLLMRSNMLEVMREVPDGVRSAVAPADWRRALDGYADVVSSTDLLAR